MPIGRRQGLGFEAVVRGSARKEYWLYFLRTMTGRVNSRLLPSVSYPMFFPQPDPPHFRFAKIEPRGFVRGVGGFLDTVPAIEIPLHR
jgi:hypothetical protein